MLRGLVQEYYTQDRFKVRLRVSSSSLRSRLAKSTRDLAVKDKLNANRPVRTVVIWYGQGGLGKISDFVR